MPRDIPVGNGQMLVTFDHHYQVRDIYFPHVGQENHAGGGPCRFGVFGEIVDPTRGDSDRRKQRLFWSDNGWGMELGYEPDTLSTRVKMSHHQLKIEMHCSDVVDFHRPVHVRRIEVHNKSDQDRDLRLFHHNDFFMYGTRVGDTAYYDPKMRCLIHYRKSRYLMACWYADGEQQIDEYATGTAGFNGAEGTWRDAEDGQLGGNAIAQGAVDSTMMLRVRLAPHESKVVYLIIGAGECHADIQAIHRFLHRSRGPQEVIDRTEAYWRLWLAASRVNFPQKQESGLSQPVINLFKRSLLVVRSQIDNGGAIIAANDTDYMQYSRDTYSYLWPRDGAFVAEALDAAGFSDVARSFYSLCAKIITDEGYFLHKYNPDGTPASSWHPWVSMGKPQLPIQEDETALVIWALWRHYVRFRDIEFVRPLWIRLIRPAGDFLVRYRDPHTKLPLPSYDLWEERWGVHAFTVASVFAGLRAAWQFAVCFGDNHRANAYATAAEQTRDAFDKHLWSGKHKRYLRRVVPLDHDRTARDMAAVMDMQTPRDEPGEVPGEGDNPPIEFELDPVVDSSLFAIYALGMKDPRDERVIKTMQAVEKRLWVKTKVGGVARYEGDPYHQMVHNQKSVPGNPWFICTLWLADHKIARAQTVDELKEALPIFEWVAGHALPSGVLAEQVHPQTNAPLSVSPLTWSHATVVSTLTRYLAKLEKLGVAARTPVIRAAPFEEPIDG